MMLMAQVDEVDIFLQAQVQAWSWARFGGIGFQKTFENGVCTLLTT